MIAAGGAGGGPRPRPGSVDVAVTGGEGAGRRRPSRRELEARWDHRRRSAAMLDRFTAPRARTGRRTARPSPSSSAASSSIITDDRGVDRPVRHRPGVGRRPRPVAALSGSRVAVDVGLGVGERQGDHRGVEQPLPAERRRAARRQGDVPEPGRSRRPRARRSPALGVAGARCPAAPGRRSAVEQLGGVDRPWVEGPDHPPAADDLGELGMAVGRSAARAELERGPRPWPSRRRPATPPWLGVDARRTARRRRARSSRA